MPVSSSLGLGVGGAGLQGVRGRVYVKTHEETSGSDQYVHYFDCKNDFAGIHICENTKLCTLSMYSLLYVRLQ